MPAPIALNLYTVRDALARDFDATVRAVAVMGYAGVEPYDFKGSSPAAAARLFKELGLAVCGVHAPLPLGDQQAEVLERMDVYACRRLVCPSQPAERFKSLDGVRQACDALNQSNAVAKARGLSFGYHNHEWEFVPLEGRPAHDHLRACLAPDVFYEIDVYWARVGGVDPVAMVRDLAARAPLLHLKDGPGRRGPPQTALGDGVVDIPGVVAAAGSHAAWLIVELDEYAGDMLDAVRRSYQYLVSRGLGRGRG